MVDAPGAASVASQLLAFFHEPVRFRPQFIHGEELLPEGHVVLKFALGRFSHGWHRDLSQHDQQELIEAARAFVRQVCLWERATHYQVLCLEPSAGRDAIRENYRLLMALIHPDRQEAAHEWPTGCAQRVNEAYATLSEGHARATYDAGLRRARVAAPFEPAALSVPRSATNAGRGGYLRPALVVSGVVAALFVVQSWWVSDVPQHYALLERAFPLRASAQWVRDVLPNAELPRFMEFKPAVAFDPLELLAPSKQPYRLASVSVGTPAAAGTPAPVVEVRAPVQLAPPPVAASATPREAPAPPLRLAQATMPAPVAMPAATPSQSATGVPTTQDVELVVARLVSFYEIGDTEGLMSLFDSDEMGFWKGLRTRSTYADFFRATKQRRLRMNRLNWQAAAQSAQARGDATVVADYADGSGKLERKADIEIDIAVRGGQARITRLSLFPDGR